MTGTVKKRHAASHLIAARAYAANSFAERLKVGALLAKGDNIISHGWNGRLPGEPNVCEIDPNTTHPEVRHAEINALNKLRKYHETSVGAIMYVTHNPCRNCAMDMQDSRVLGVAYEEDYRSSDGLIYLLNKGMSIYKMMPNQDFIRLELDNNGEILKFPVQGDILTFRLWF